MDRLGWLAESVPEIDGCDGWGLVPDLLGQPLPDHAVRPAIERLRGGDSAWLAILLFLFWPSLEAIYHRRRRWGDGTDQEFWADVVLAFHEAVVRADPVRRPEGLGRKIFNDTSRGLYLASRREWTHRRRHGLAAEEATALGLHHRDPDWELAREATDWRCDREFRRRFYLRLLRHRTITWQDYVLLGGTRICGWTVAVCADRLGITAEAAKKRLQRAERRIQAVDPLVRRGDVPFLG